MRRSDLMEPDLLSEIIVVGGGVVAFAPLLFVLFLTITQAAGQQ